MSQPVNVTQKVETGLNFNELLPLTRCVCGTPYVAWDFIVPMGPGNASAECDHCKRRFYFTLTITVWEVI